MPPSPAAPSPSPRRVRSCSTGAPPAGAALIEEGDAEPADGTGDDPARVAHEIEGPSDVTAVLELFDRRYRDLRGADEPYSTEDPGFGGPGS